jgi:hypothetical protein
VQSPGHAEGHGGLIRAKPGAGSATEVVPEHEDIDVIALDATNVYWVESHSNKLRVLARSR